METTIMTKTKNRPAMASHAETRREPASQRPTKLQMLIELLRRPEGARLEELTAATGW